MLSAADFGIIFPEIPGLDRELQGIREKVGFAAKRFCRRALDTLNHCGVAVYSEAVNITDSLAKIFK